MPLYAKTLADRRFLSWNIPKMIPRIAKGFPIKTRALDSLPGGKRRSIIDRKASGTDTSPNDRLVMAKAGDRFLLESV